jgi:acetate kinase
MLFDWLKKSSSGKDLAAVGHRIVHGGPKFREPMLLTSDRIRQLGELIPLAPEHLPPELKAIKSVYKFLPHIKQVACFDTGFHRHMPRISQIYPLPMNMWENGIRRYGFHGLSYEYILQELENEEGSEILGDRIIIAHLGNGASMAAIKDSKSVDTTMGFTPAGGLIMGTRSGDIDPGVIVYLEQKKGFNASDINRLINEEAGLKGVSGVSSNMKDLLERVDTEDSVREAVELFCYQARKYLGALTAVLGGLDTLIFTAGIGENSPDIRWRICLYSKYLGIQLDKKKNIKNEGIISSDKSQVTVRVMKTNEELMIARHTRRLKMISNENSD